MSMFDTRIQVKSTSEPVWARSADIEIRAFSATKPLLLGPGLRFGTLPSDDVAWEVSAIFATDDQQRHPQEAARGPEAPGH